VLVDSTRAAAEESRTQQRQDGFPG
jgi:hypothetical protein